VVLAGAAGTIGFGVWNGDHVATHLAPAVEPWFLRAGQIKTWAKCGSDAERLACTKAGILLFIGAAFDAGLISFRKRCGDTVLLSFPRATEKTSGFAIMLPWPRRS
jgi:hypothetical protein